MVCAKNVYVVVLKLQRDWTFRKDSSETPAYSDSFERLVLREGLERIGRTSFGGCESLAKVDVPWTVTMIGEGLEQIERTAFGGCESLAEVDVPSTVVLIGEGAFHKCESLKRLGLNEGLKRIGLAAFYGSKSLRTKFRQLSSILRKVRSRLLMHNGLEEIGEIVFLAMRILSRSGHSRNCQADWQCCISIVRKVGESFLASTFQSMIVVSIYSDDAMTVLYFLYVLSACFWAFDRADISNYTIVI
eukprot:scaffold101_cov123-Cylindrotheca_fusiformis.AAC.5